MDKQATYWNLPVGIRKNEEDIFWKEWGKTQRAKRIKQKEGSQIIASVAFTTGKIAALTVASIFTVFPFIWMILSCTVE